MFTGLVEEIGAVRSVQARSRMRVLTITAERVITDTRVGDSIAVDGVCQTVTAIGDNWFSVETLAASLDKTNLGDLRSGRRVNLERALLPTTRLGGHFVQGHVDGTATVERIDEEGANVFFSVRLPENLLRYCIREGSIAIDGVSLTIAELRDPIVTINVIPTTWNDTALADRRPGDRVNIEVDVLARYVARMMERPGEVRTPSPEPHPGITEARLREMGY